MRGKIHLHMPLVLGLCGTLVIDPLLEACYGLLPTKTSQWLIQLGGSRLSFPNIVSQVFNTRLVNLFSRLIFVKPRVDGIPPPCVDHCVHVLYFSYYSLVGKLPYDVNKTLTCLITEGNDFLLFLLQKN